MDETRLPPEVPFPPAPWRLTGELWMGVFPTSGTTSLPSGLKPLFNPRWRVLMVVRYTGGTRSYDELVVGAISHRGWRFGLFVEHIWVPDAVGLWAGRRIWGLPKQLATFSWQGDTVQVADEAGPIATVTLNRRPAKLPRIWLIAPSFGRLDPQWTYVPTRLRAQVGKAGMSVDSFSGRFPYKLEPQPIFAFAAKRFDMLLPVPTLLPVDKAQQPVSRPA